MAKYYEEFGVIEKARQNYVESLKYLSYLEKSKKLYIEDFLKKYDKFIKEIDFIRKIIKEGRKED